MTAIRLGRPALDLRRPGATGRAFTSSSVPVEGIVSMTDIHFPACSELVRRSSVSTRVRLVRVELRASNGPSFADLREPVLANGSQGQYRLAAPGRLIKIDQIVINPEALSQTKRGFSGNVKRGSC